MTTARRTVSLPPTELRRAGSPLASDSVVAEFGEVLDPTKAEPPILHPAVRQAVFMWLTELNAADDLAAHGLTPRKTAMLSGPPGTGKTTLAHHLAARLGLPLVVIDMHRLASKFVSASGENIGKLFRTLRQRADECVVLLDEFDALGAKRTESSRQAADREANKVVSALLVEIERHTGILVAATNLADAIDPAIWRRFHIHIPVELPGIEERWSIIARYLEPLRLPDESIDILAHATDGAMPALLRGLMEGIKRDLVLAPRIHVEADARSVLTRVTTMLRPPPEMTVPPLWAGEDVVATVAGAIAWPPEKGGG